jgi:hypothetical protein
VIKDGREGLEGYPEDLFVLAVVGLDVIAKLLDDVAVGQPDDLVVVLVGHQPLPARSPHLRPLPVPAHSLLPHVLLLYARLDVIADVGLPLALLLELGVEGLHGGLVAAVAVVLELGEVDVVVDCLWGEGGEEVHLEDLVSMLFDLQGLPHHLALQQLHFLARLLQLIPDLTDRVGL